MYKQVLDWVNTLLSVYGVNVCKMLTLSEGSRKVSKCRAIGWGPVSNAVHGHMTTMLVDWSDWPVTGGAVAHEDAMPAYHSVIFVQQHMLEADLHPHAAMPACRYNTGMNSEHVDMSSINGMP